MTTQPSWIRGIFTNVLFVIGVILLIIAAVRGTGTIVRLVVFDKYPLDASEEERCYPTDPTVAEAVAALSAQEREQHLEDCLERLELSRRHRLVDDVSTTIALFVSGVVLTWVFKQFIFVKTPSS